MTGALELPPEIMEWMGSAAKGEVVSAIRVPGGATREAWFVAVDDHAGGTTPLFLRYSRGLLPPTSASHTLRVEGEIFQALEAAGVNVPRTIALHPTLEALLEERVSGETWFYRLTDPDEQVRTAQDFMRHLARVHTIDASTLGLTSLGPVLSVEEHVRQSLAVIRRRSTADDGSIEPLLELSLDWLEENVPDFQGPAVLVQGDTGPGNFMYEGGHVTAVVDWELAHFGDPMEDIAWLSLRTVQDTFTHLPDRLREYEELSGIEIDDDRVWYYRLHAETLLTSVRAAAAREQPVAASGEPQARDIGNGLIYGVLHRRLTIQALAHLLGSTLPVADLPAVPDAPPWHGLYDDVLENLRVITPRVDDPLAAGWIKGVARVVRHLKELDLEGRSFMGSELDDLGQLTGSAPTSVAAGHRALEEAVRAGRVSRRDYVEFLWRQVSRDDHLLRTASGSLRERSWPPLRDEG